MSLKPVTTSLWEGHDFSRAEEWLTNGGFSR